MTVATRQNLSLPSTSVTLSSTRSSCVLRPQDTAPSLFLFPDQRHPDMYRSIIHTLSFNSSYSCSLFVDVGALSLLLFSPLFFSSVWLLYSLLCSSLFCLPHPHFKLVDLSSAFLAALKLYVPSLQLFSSAFFFSFCFFFSSL